MKLKILKIKIGKYFFKKVVEKFLRNKAGKSLKKLWENSKEINLKILKKGGKSSKGGGKISNK